MLHHVIIEPWCLSDELPGETFTPLKRETLQHFPSLLYLKQLTLSSIISPPGLTSTSSDRDSTVALYID